MKNKYSERCRDMDVCYLICLVVDKDLLSVKICKIKKRNKLMIWTERYGLKCYGY